MFKSLLSALSVVCVIIPSARKNLIKMFFQYDFRHHEGGGVSCFQWWNPPLKLSNMITQGNPGYTLGFEP